MAGCPGAYGYYGALNIKRNSNLSSSSFDEDNKLDKKLKKMLKKDKKHLEIMQSDHKFLMKRLYDVINELNNLK